jgi:Tfp pilus assembly ATPase PilU
MQTFDQALYQAITQGEITLEDARRYATRPHDLKLVIDAGGRVGTSMDDVPQRPSRRDLQMQGSGLADPSLQPTANGH